MIGGIFLGYSGRNIDMKMHSPTRVEQDGVPFDLFLQMEQLKAEIITKKTAMRVECPVCEYPTGILLIDREGYQSLKCGWCKSPSIFVKTVFGNWKIKSSVGTEYLNDKKRTFRSKTIQ